MLLGIDQTSTGALNPLKKKKVGVLCHAASLNQNFIHLVHLLQKENLNVTTLFGPEHGVWGVAQDMETVDHQAVDPVFNLPVHSLYGKDFDSLKPKKEWLKNIDGVVCDLQDVGSRYYTFVYSIILMMQVCAEMQIPVYLLDRPNPINGIQTEGNLVNTGFESFVGLYPIPNRHALTIGELALYINQKFEIRSDLTVIAVKGWKRNQYFDETGLPWVLPSPNMPTLDTAIVYPGLCLLEATEISEGRGTTRPFELFGAPYIEPEKLVSHLKDFGLNGVVFRPTYFKPMFQKLAGEVCGGAQIHLTDREVFRPYQTGLAILKAIHDLYPEEFKWRAKPYEFVQEIPAIDLLTGSDQFRKTILDGNQKQFSEFVEKQKVSSFEEEAREVWLYPF